MTKYTIRKLNPVCKQWVVYMATIDMTAAYNTHARLIAMGYQASITSEYVSEAVT